MNYVLLSRLTPRLHFKVLPSSLSSIDIITSCKQFFEYNCGLYSMSFSAGIAGHDHESYRCNYSNMCRFTVDFDLFPTM